MSVYLDSKIRQDALAWVQSLAKERDSLAIYPRKPIQSHEPQSLWGKIFSFLPSDSKQSVALTSKGFNAELKKEKERYVEAVARFISDNYVILDTNIDLSSLKKAIKLGITFLLGDIHLKPSHLRLHEAFMQVALTPETRIFTENSPSVFTKDPHLLAQAEPWGVLESLPAQKAFNSKNLKMAPKSISQELIRVLQNTNFYLYDISVALTLFYLCLVDEEDCQRFTQALLFFHKLFNTPRPPQWPSDSEMQALAYGQGKPSNFVEIKCAFLGLLLQSCDMEEIQRYQLISEKEIKINHHENRNDDLVEKISKIFHLQRSATTQGSCDIAQGGRGHFHYDHGIGNFLNSGDKIRPFCAPLGSKLTQKNIPYIVLYPREPLIYQKETFDAEEHKKFMMIYSGIDFALASTKGKNHESPDDYLRNYSKEELKQKFLDFLTKEKEAERGFPWRLAGGIVRDEACKAYEERAQK